MTAQPTAEVHGPVTVTISARDSAAEVARWSAGTLFGLLATAAILVAWRRIAGALSSPLDSVSLLAVALVVAATACGVRLLWQRLPVVPVGRSLFTRSSMLSAAVSVLGLSLSLSGTTVGGLLAFWAVVAAEELWAWRPAVWRNLQSMPVSVVPPRVEPQLRVVCDEPYPLPVAADEIPPQEVLQQLTRSQAADGSEQLAGWLRMAFAAGQRTGSLHVAFCPPFAKTPELTVEQLDGPDARVKTAQLLPYGVRLDLKLAAPSDAPASVLLQFSARSEGLEAAAPTSRV